MRFGNHLNSVRVIVEEYLRERTGDSARSVTFGNISNLDEINNNLKDGTHVLMSLVGLEEEKSLRYFDTKTITHDENLSNTNIYNHNPVVYLNLHLLFSVPVITSNYSSAINMLGIITEFFQTKNVIDVSQDNINDDNYIRLEKLVFELYSLSFEQMNHLWGVLGGKYMPSVLYKVRLIPIRGDLHDKSSFIRVEELKGMNI